jgi:hypothetical protein
MASGGRLEIGLRSLRKGPDIVRPPASQEDSHCGSLTIAIVPEELAYGTASRLGEVEVSDRVYGDGSRVFESGDRYGIDLAAQPKFRVASMTN